MKLYSNRKKLYNKQVSKPMSEEKYLNQLEKIETKFDLIQSYFYSITEEQDKKDQKEYMEKVKLSKIRRDYNKMQSIHRERNEGNYYY